MRQSGRGAGSRSRCSKSTRLFYVLQIHKVTPIFIQVERGLWLFQTGDDALSRGAQDIIHDGTSPFSNGHGLGFTEHPWGTKAREFVTSTMKLKDSHWTEIADDIAIHKLLGRDGQNMEVDSDEDDNGDDNGVGGVRRVNPRARIDID